MLSLDRYATVKNPRLAQLRQRRFLPIFLAFASWLSAIFLSIPVLLAYNIGKSENNNTELSQFEEIKQVQTPIGLSNEELKENSFNEDASITSVCYPNFGTMGVPSVFLAVYAILVFILPGVGVVLNHFGVHKRLCALSLTARAAHGELPLPMPLLRRPTHRVIIVTGMANAAVVEDDSSNDENQQKDERRHMMDSTRLKATPRTPR